MTPDAKLTPEANLTPDAKLTPEAKLKTPLENALNKMNIHIQNLDKLPEERYDDVWERLEIIYNLIEEELTALKDARCKHVFIADVPDYEQFKNRRRLNLLFCSGAKRM